MEVRRVDLAHWALRTSPKITTGVKYQFHQGVWSGQRSENMQLPKFQITDRHWFSGENIHEIMSEFPLSLLFKIFLKFII